MTLGEQVQDRITGFAGIVAGIVNIKPDSAVYLVVPVNADGTPQFGATAKWFNEKRLHDVHVVDLG